MTANDYLRVALFLLLILAATPLLGGWMARIFQGQPTLAGRWLGPVERALYRLAGVRADEEMSWKRYAGTLLAIDALCLAWVFLLQGMQGSLPLNPQGMPAVGGALALNTAVSFATNTNWQAYSGEASLSALTQMLGLGTANFLSAATGIAGLLALTRGIARRSSRTLGNAWVDLTRAILYVLLPLSFLLALALMSQGVPQTFAAYPVATTLAGHETLIPLGPAASQIAIKQLGTNGGGFFGVNSAHPFENPTPLSNFLQVLAILLLPAALTATFGRMVGAPRQGWALFSAMAVLFIASLGLSLWSEYTPNAAMGSAAPLEGKELRFGVTHSVLWSTATTAASNGSVNAMHSSLSAASGGLALLNLLLGEVVFGGVGSGLYGMLLFALLAVFLAGLMVGRTPEYLGKKIEAAEIRLVAFALLIPAAVVLVLSALAASTDAGRSGNAHTGPHGLTEILYAFGSMGNNNGSAFGGLGANSPFYLLWGSLAMLIGRYAVLLPVLAIAGGFAAKKITPPSVGSFPTDRPLFVGLLAGVVVVESGLTFFPALTLGPLLEQVLQLLGRPL